MASDIDYQLLKQRPNIASWRLALAKFVESNRVQVAITAAIMLNALILGLETSARIHREYGPVLHGLDRLLLALFVAEIGLKVIAYRAQFWRNGWNVFDFAVVAIALVPGAGVWAVLRSLRVLRVLRLLTVVPQLKKVVAAFLHAIPGLGGVMAVMMIFFYTAGVLATNLFGGTHQDWFGTLGRSLYTLFQVMTLESWSMGIVRPVMEEHPWAWAFFVPFIVIATFTILNLFIGIIVSTMQELSITPDPTKDQEVLTQGEERFTSAIDRVEQELQRLRKELESLESRPRT